MRAELLSSSYTDTMRLAAGTRQLCRGLNGLSRGQQRVCSLYQDHMTPVARGASMAIKASVFFCIS